MGEQLGREFGRTTVFINSAGTKKGGEGAGTRLQKVGVGQGRMKDTTPLQLWTNSFNIIRVEVGFSSSGATSQAVSLRDNL